jgi:hypothetical protein
MVYRPISNYIYVCVGVGVGVYIYKELKQLALQK